ncbi:MAG TPA: hypothetical protein PL041_04535 [Melioribacteraceae bacterium]|nr:hypothetical protein [Melioribacteraceae bacterium]
MYTKKDLINYSFKFKFEDEREITFHIKIEPLTMNLLRDNTEYPEWTKLENFKCPHCPLNSSEFNYCPVAVNLNCVIKSFNNVSSFDKVFIDVNSDERGYYKKTDVQSGVSSLIGILMVTSGCPIMVKLKPMVRFHLPFATLEETEYKVFSMYLLAQFIKKINGKQPDWDLFELQKIYDDIKILNLNVASKIADLESKDASINAVVVLNNFADIVSFNIEEQDLTNFNLYFKDYIDSDE